MFTALAMIIHEWTIIFLLGPLVFKCKKHISRCVIPGVVIIIAGILIFVLRSEQYVSWYYNFFTLLEISSIKIWSFENLLYYIRMLINWQISLIGMIFFILGSWYTRKLPISRLIFLWIFPPYLFFTCILFFWKEWIFLTPLLPIIAIGITAGLERVKFKKSITMIVILFLAVQMYIVVLYNIPGSNSGEYIKLFPVHNLPNDWYLYFGLREPVTQEWNLRKIEQVSENSSWVAVINDFPDIVVPLNYRSSHPKYHYGWSDEADLVLVKTTILPDRQTIPLIEKSLLEFSTVKWYYSEGEEVDVFPGIVYRPYFKK